MLIKIGEDYYKIIANDKEVTDENLLKEIVTVLKVARNTMDLCEDYVSGDDMSYLDTSDDNRVRIYNDVISTHFLKRNLYPRLARVKSTIAVEIF